MNSCNKMYFYTNTNLTPVSNKYYIESYEVSIGDWITYIVTSSFSELDGAVFLGDHTELIKDKLPELEQPGWTSYVVRALLRKEKNMTCQKVYKNCNIFYFIFRISISKTAWDSIKKYNLLDLPVTGITFEQAQKYIEFLQDKSDSFGISLKGNKNKYRFECFLPTPAQFDSFLIPLDSFTKCPTFNFKNSVCPDCPSGKKFKDHPVLKNVGKEPIYIYTNWPNCYGLFNFQGNVSEMTSIKGIAKGGSCFHPASEANKGKIQTYTKPEIWLGFRVWYRVYEEKK